MKMRYQLALWIIITAIIAGLASWWLGLIAWVAGGLIIMFFQKPKTDYDFGTGLSTILVMCMTFIGAVGVVLGKLVF
jgi:hypothetical protein